MRSSHWQRWFLSPHFKIKTLHSYRFQVTARYKSGNRPGIGMDDDVIQVAYGHRQTVGTVMSTICVATKMVLLSHLYGNVSGLKEFDINIDAMEDTSRRRNEATVVDTLWRLTP